MIDDLSALGTLFRRGVTALESFPPWELREMDSPGVCPAPGACISLGDRNLSIGEVDEAFTLMSAVKPFLLLYQLQQHGIDTVFQWVGRKASTLPYYSLKQLDQDHGMPRNAMLNSGAMLLAAKLPGDNPRDQCARFQQWLRELVPGAIFDQDLDCLGDLLQPGSDPTNLQIAERLQRVGSIADAAAAYEVYFRVCCIKSSVKETAKLARHLAFHPQDQALAEVLHQMEIAGLYEASADWWSRHPYPSKSGVSGIMFAVQPSHGAAAVGSAWLDSGGNPILGQVLLPGMLGPASDQHLLH
jgi:glutaminase